MSRTTTIVIIGLVLCVVFLAVGRLVHRIGVRRAAEDFLLVWLALTVGNMAVGVIDEGYGVVEEIPYLLINFVPAALVATLAWVLDSRAAKGR
jgi:uncharacterized membrane protein YwaF